MTSISFEVPGEPRGKGRPRFARRGKFTTTYTDDKTVTYENRVMMAAAAAMGAAGLLEPFSGPVALVVRARLQPPSSGSKKRLAAMLAGELRPTKTPDAANIVCAVQDGMNQVVYRDDRQVVQITATKHWSADPGLTVTVSEVLP